MEISSNGIELIKSFEGLRLTPYLDSAGKDTIGYGHLILPGEQFGAITQSQATEILKNDVAKAERIVKQRITAELNQNQYDSLVSLAFNVPEALYSGTVDDKINNHEPLDVLEKTWKAWSKVKNSSGQLVTSGGLVDRRSREWDLYTNGSSTGVSFEKKKIIPIVIIVVAIIVVSKI